MGIVVNSKNLLKSILLEYLKCDKVRQTNKFFMKNIFNDYIQNFLNEYFSTLSFKDKSKITNISSDYFCADKKNADLCSDLVLNGVKTASCSLKESYSHTEDELPAIGDLLIVTNWESTPVCIVEFIEISEVKFLEVDELHAFKEGEGDRTLSWWRDVHIDFFTNECEELGITFDESMTLVLEYFKVVYPKLS